MTATAVLLGAATAASVLAVLLSFCHAPPGWRWWPPPAPVRHAVVAVTASRARAGRAARRRAHALADDLPEAAELLAIAAAAGCNVRLALDAVRRARDGPAVGVIAAVLADVDVGGRRLADALGRAPAVHGEAVRPLAALLADAERYGTPLGPALERLADDLRHRRRRRAEERARQLPVRLLLPLVLCILPAFALLTVAPLLASGLQALADHPPTAP
jgi:tight adherence protein C